MQISFTFKNVDSSEFLKSHTHEKFDRLDKMFDNPADAHIVLSVEKLRNIAEINLTCDKIKVHAKEESGKNMYAAIDTLSDKVKSQIIKNTEKLKRHLSGDKVSIKTDFTDFISSDNLVENSSDG
jgi:putative sigma-54 modulation protein